MSRDKPAYYVGGTEASTPDHVRGVCSRCGGELWYSAPIAPPRVPKVCVACFLKDSGREHASHAVLESTLEEIAGLRGSTVDEAFELCQRTIREQLGVELRRVKDP